MTPLRGQLTETTYVPRAPDSQQSSYRTFSTLQEAQHDLSFVLGQLRVELGKLNEHGHEVP